MRRPGPAHGLARVPRADERDKGGDGDVDYFSVLVALLLVES
ncbi:MULTISPECIES: hypothetical protein [unclassified Cryobacterium]|nr:MULTISPECIES: hypothetical protein [unclassified Cryobacterium]